MDQLNACFSSGVLELKDVSEFFEGFAQMGTGAVDGGFNGGDAGAEGLRDFLVAEVLLLKEQDGLPLFGGQIVKGAVKGFFNFGSAIFGAGLLLEGPIVWVDEFEGPAGAAPLEIDEATAGEGEEVGIKGVAGLIAGKGAIEVNKGLLGEVFGIDAVAEAAVEETDETRLPTIDNAFKCVGIALRGGAHAGTVNVLDYRFRTRG